MKFATKSVFIICSKIANKTYSLFQAYNRFHDWNIQKFDNKDTGFAPFVINSYCANGPYEILQGAMKEGLRMSGWRASNLCEQEKIWMNEWMNEWM